jgi:hypothetical protein
MVYWDKYINPVKSFSSRTHIRICQNAPTPLISVPKIVAEKLVDNVTGKKKTISSVISDDFTRGRQYIQSELSGGTISTPISPYVAS